MRDVTLGQTVLDNFPVYDIDGYTKLSGVTGFTVYLWKDTVPNATAVTITEIGTTGEYQISLTPDSAGVWACEILIPTNKEAWYGEYDVRQSSLEFTASMAEDGTTARFTVWGEDVFGRAEWLSSMTADIRDGSGGLVTALGSGVGPTADGTFLFTCLASLLYYNVPYYVSVTASNGSVIWTGNCGFVRVE